MRPRGNKYRNKITVVDGASFHSAKESRRWGELRLLERAGKITDLTRQHKIPLVVNGKLVCTINPDFRYFVDGSEVLEDTKSPITRKNPAWRIKVKLLKALTGMEIMET